MQAEYLGTNFEVTSKTLRSLATVSLKRETKYTETDARDGLPQIDVTGYEPQSLSIEFKAHAGLGVNPLTEYSRWKKRLGKSGAFYLGGRQFGVDVFVLTSVKLTETALSNSGKINTGTIALQLDQDIIVTEKKG